jgi:hypothetical protein
MGEAVVAGTDDDGVVGMRVAHRADTFRGGL